MVGGSDKNEEIEQPEEDEELEEDEKQQQQETITEDQQDEDKIDLIRILEKISPNQLNQYFDEPQSILKSRPTLPSVDELSGKMFDGFLNSRLKDVSKWESKCNVKTYPPSQDLDQDYATFLEEMDELDEEAISNSGNKSSKSKGKKGSFFSGIKKSLGFKGGASEEAEPEDADEDDDEEGEQEPEVPQKGFMGHLEDVENYFIDKWKGVDLYQVIDELKPKPALKAIKNPKFILDKNKPPQEEGDGEDLCSGEWDLIMDHICQIRVRSHIIYLESLKTIDPELESNYDPQLLTQNNFEYDPENNPDGFKLDENIHYFHEPKPLTAMEKMKKKMEKKMRAAKRTMRRIGNKISSIKKTIKRKVGEAGRAVTSASVPSMSLPSLSSGPKKPPPKLNLVQKAVAHGVYGGEDNFRKVQKRFNSPTGKLLANHYKI